MNPMVSDFSKLDTRLLPSPCFVVDECALEHNLKILNEVQTKSGAKILHALKAFSMHALAQHTNNYLSGCCVSGLNEALLAKEFYTGEIHVFSPAYKEKDLVQLLEFCHHVIFNSCSQLEKFAALCQAAKSKRPELHFGLRINPEHSEGEYAMYDPCAKKSRLGITLQQLQTHLQSATFKQAFALISGFHFHTLCEQGFEPLDRTIDAFEQKFSGYFPQLSWLNFGGGHHITRSEYNREGLIRKLNHFAQKHQLALYLEPGEAVAIGTGVLISEVLDIGFNELPQMILDTSATCHMPDVLEMPYRPVITGSATLNEKPYNYRLGGPSCLAGDVIGDYSFDAPLKVGDRIMFEDMAHYTMVKTTTFNGVNLPSIAIWNSHTNTLKLQRSFGYEDFKNRLS